MPYAVKSGKTTISCHRKKASAKKVANARRRAGKKARIVRRKSCG